jgi:sulfide:quinone oxidoreductase
MRIAVLGAGFGGLEIVTRLADALDNDPASRDVEIVLVDRAPGFVFGFSKLDVMFGRLAAEQALHPYGGFEARGIRFVQSTIRAIDPMAKRVTTDVETIDADILVVALGADLEPDATSGLREGGREFYTVSGAFALRDVIANFDGGRVIVGVTSAPFKCPPAPSETALLMHDHLTRKGLRAQSSIDLVMPLPTPIPPSPDASRAVLAAFAERDITFHAEKLVTALDPGRRVALISDGSEMAYDLFLAIPRHKAPDVVVEAGLAVDGWVPVDPFTLATAFPDVYAVGDVTSVGTPKAGVFSEGQGAVVAERIIARINDEEPTATYDGHGMCYLEFGEGEVAQVDVTFLPGERPHGDLNGPSAALAADKSDFGSSRIARWLPGRD